LTGNSSSGHGQAYMCEFEASWKYLYDCTVLALHTIGQFLNVIIATLTYVKIAIITLFLRTCEVFIAKSKTFHVFLIVTNIYILIGIHPEE
jgi:hypothetical protein